ncbi:MAG: hypothetical protein KAS66_04430 [Candidatus Omnitrophica bacterium]|nr:hypothetical protein [Candidatus Omnitrophota bacterium]
MRKIILIAIFVCIGFSISVYQVVNAVEDRATSVRSQGFDESLRNICNHVMIAVYNDILSIKEDHDNLVNFGEHVLSQNQHRIYSIEYKREISEGARKGEFLKFGVTIVKPEDTNFKEFGQRAFNFSFPLLDLKFTGYQQTNRKWMKFDIQDVVRRNGDLLLEEQKKHLPLKLSLKTDKEYYNVRENIEVTVTLENVSRSNLWVKNLDNETLYFLYGDAKWGTVAVGEKRKRKLILKPGKKIHKKFVGSGSSIPREIEIYGSYNMTFKGVKPSSVLKVKIVE